MCSFYFSKNLKNYQKYDTDLKLKDIEKKIVESKNVLLQWILGMMTGYTILLIVILRFFEK